MKKYLLCIVSCIILIITITLTIAFGFNYRFVYRNDFDGLFGFYLIDIPLLYHFFGIPISIGISSLLLIIDKIKRKDTNKVFRIILLVLIIIAIILFIISRLYLDEQDFIYNNTYV